MSVPDALGYLAQRDGADRPLFQVFTRFVSYVEQAVQNAMFHALTRQHRNFDQDTGLPNAAYLGKRIQEEMQSMMP